MLHLSFEQKIREFNKRYNHFYSGLGSSAFTVQQYFESIPGIGGSFAQYKKKAIMCMDERIRLKVEGVEKIGIPGTGVLNQKEVMNLVNVYGPEGVDLYSHEGCGASALHASMSGVTDVEAHSVGWGK